ncbi:hypothetical protein GCM10010116_11790 [Microbispora rosea subsp. aerata]|nr:hypothetical protein GCM10010116_11790 [Microbispora rosea subsp. aerata]GIH55212.1 hypothetical protein Mro02_21260 [Microbispora rosea subsp. aerata]GLJ82662.1 hypothetical protein GCM10017588_13870 [Microbispora rosea subsp. aerata]
MNVSTLSRNIAVGKAHSYRRSFLIVEAVDSAILTPQERESFSDAGTIGRQLARAGWCGPTLGCGARVRRTDVRVNASIGRRPGRVRQRGLIPARRADIRESVAGFARAGGQAR